MANHGQGNDRSRTTPLRVRFRGKRDARVPSVFCPRRLESVDTAECLRCRDGQGLSFNVAECALYMNCGWPRDGLQLPTGGQADDSTLGGLIAKPPHCLEQEAPLSSALPAFVRGGVDAAVVVDAAGRTVGILSKSDLLRWVCTARTPGADRPAADLPIAVERSVVPRVREAMSHLVFTLPAEADVARAAALMAYEGVHQIVVTAPDGRPIGMVSSLDISRCIARRNGYVLSESD